MWNTTSTSSINPYHKKRRNGTLNPQKKNKTKTKDIASTQQLFTVAC
jgi:hypothetical protein